MVDLDSRTLYELLGLEPDATTERIKEAYREIARIYHPDSNFYSDIIADDSSNEDSDVFKAITNAYQILICEEKRRAYDNSLPKNLDSWGDDSDNDRFDANSEQHVGAEAYSRGSKETAHNIPEEWRREREYFEANYQEILRPAPKADLVGAEIARDDEIGGDKESQFGEWEEPKAFIPGSRFGELNLDAENKVPYTVAPTRRAVKQNIGTGIDPMSAVLYIGIPALLSIVLIEIYLFM